MRENIKVFFINLTRQQKTLLLILSDLLVFNYIFFIAYFISFNFYSFSEYENTFFVFSKFNKLNVYHVLFINFISIGVIALSNGYKSFFRSSNIANLIGLSRWLGLILFSFSLALSEKSSGASFFESIQTGMMGISIIFFGMYILRMFAFNFLSRNSEKLSQPIIIYGAGQAGRETAAYLTQNKKFNVLGFIDDDKRIKHFNILGYKVIGNIKKIKKIKKDFPNLIVLMAIIDLSPKERIKIISLLEKFEVHVKTIPKNYGALETKLSIEDISLNDLIDRDTSKPKKELLKKNISKKSVLITGAGGSIGSELSEQVANLNPSELILVDSSEFNLYNLRKKFESYKTLSSIKFILRDIRNKDELRKIFTEYKIDTIYHAAAYKHVPLLQEKENFFAAIDNNFFSTFEMCKLSVEYNISNLVLISSDKAVNPPNLMGASKRLAELSLQAFQLKRESKTTFSIVRFGNVINSSGSVIPLFWEQISSGGPITVTHKDVNRYFMTITEAASLVIQASAMSSGGEVFLLDMGSPIRIKELAEKMIRLSGNSVADFGEDNGIGIVYSGLRPGEKLNEELLLSNNPKDTDHPKIKKGIEKNFNLEEIISLKNNLEKSLRENNFKESKKIISFYVDGYI